MSSVSNPGGPQRRGAPHSPGRAARRARHAVAACGAALALVLTTAAATAPPAHALAAADVTSGDATIGYDATAGTWTMQTAGIRRVVRFADGSLLQTSLVNRKTGRELQQSGKSSEFRVRVAGVDHRGSTGAWTLDGQQVTQRGDGALVLTIDLHDSVLGVRRTYVVYPGTAVIEERTDVTNRTSAAISVTDYAAISMRVLGDDAADVDLLTMSGDKAATIPWHQLRAPVAMTTGVRTFTGNGGNVNAEFLSVCDRTTGDGVVATWDYTGTWGLTVGDSYGKILIEPRATVATPLAAGATIQGPLGRIGLYQGDTDDMGNAVLDFTYRYLWDHTDDEYFPLVRYGGYGSDPTTVAQKIDQLAYLGGDMVWIDDGWQDAVGDWNDRPGQPIAQYRDLAARYGQHIGLWLVPWGAEGSSAVAAAHPAWMVDASNRKAGLDTTLPGVVDHIRETLNARQDEFGPFMLKTDFGADSGNLAKANATTQILTNFVADNPDAALQLCSDGGGLLNLGTAGLSDLVLQQDGTGTRADGYWSSLLYPTEKLIETYGRTTIGSAYQAGNRHLLSFHLTVAGDTTAGAAALEPVRQDVDLYRYLREKQVLGRWVQVYRPTVSTGDQTGILQKLSGDGLRGYVTFPKAAFATGTTVTVYPKGLTPGQAYTISSEEGTVTKATKTGAQWMASGVTLNGYVDGEVLYLNLEDRPGAGTDTTAPTAPSHVVSAPATYLGTSGVQLTWTAGADNRWVSSVEILKNGQPFWKVSSGTFYFDRTGLATDTYEVRTVDGDGNVSGRVTAHS